MLRDGLPLAASASWPWDYLVVSHQTLARVVQFQANQGEAMRIQQTVAFPLASPSASASSMQESVHGPVVVGEKVFQQSSASQSSPFSLPTLATGHSYQQQPLRRRRGFRGRCSPQKMRCIPRQWIFEACPAERISWCLPFRSVSFFLMFASVWKKEHETRTALPWDFWSTAIQKNTSKNHSK